MNEKCFTFIVIASAKKKKGKGFAFKKRSIILASIYARSSIRAWENKKILVYPCIRLINLCLKKKEKKYDD